MPEESKIEFNSDFDTSGTHLIVYFISPWTFTETVARLITATNQIPIQSDKTSFHFVGMFNNQIFTIYDYKGDFKLHIGGTNNLDFKGLSSKLIEVLTPVIPTPFTATIPDEYADETIIPENNNGSFGWGPQVG